MFIGCVENSRRWVFPMDRVMIEKDIAGFVSDPKEYAVRNMSGNAIVRFKSSSKKHFVLLKNEEEAFEWLNK